MIKKKEFNIFTDEQIRHLIDTVKYKAELEISRPRQQNFRTKAWAYVGAGAAVAAYAHKNQITVTDNRPYIGHPLYVASKLPDPYDKQVALLHDVLEKSNLKPEHLLQMGFEQDVVNDVILLTRSNNIPGTNIPYLDYIRTVGLSLRAGRVKIEDIKHNTRSDRVIQYSEAPPEAVMLKREAYSIALPYLEAIQEGVITPGTYISDFICNTDFLKGKDAEDLFVIRRILFQLSTEPDRLIKYDRRVNKGIEEEAFPIPRAPRTVEEAKSLKAAGNSVSPAADAPPEAAL